MTALTKSTIPIDLDLQTQRQTQDECSHVTHAPSACVTWEHCHALLCGSSKISSLIPTVTIHRFRNPSLKQHTDMVDCNGLMHEGCCHAHGLKRSMLGRVRSSMERFSPMYHGVNKDEHGEPIRHDSLVTQSRELMNESCV